MSFITCGTDSEFGCCLGKDVRFSDDGQYYRIMSRVNVAGDGCYYILEACSVNNHKTLN